MAGTSLPFVSWKLSLNLILMDERLMLTRMLMLMNSKNQLLLRSLLMMMLNGVWMMLLLLLVDGRRGFQMTGSTRQLGNRGMHSSAEQVGRNCLPWMLNSRWKKKMMTEGSDEASEKAK